MKRETYQHELRLQIDEKRRLATLRDEQERHERELENRRLEQQLMRMREEQAQEDQRRQSRNELVGVLGSGIVARFNFLPFQRCDDTVTICCVEKRNCTRCNDRGAVTQTRKAPIWTRLV